MGCFIEKRVVLYKGFCIVRLMAQSRRGTRRIFRRCQRKSILSVLSEEVPFWQKIELVRPDAICSIADRSVQLPPRLVRSR